MKKNPLSNMILNKIFLLAQKISIQPTSIKNNHTSLVHKNNLNNPFFIDDIRLIHSNLELKKVLETILLLCIKNTRAKRSYFVLNKNDRLILAAEITQAKNQSEPVFEYHTDESEFKSPSEIHHNLIQDVLSQKDVKLYNQSIFCLPIRSANDIVGILFIENDPYLGNLNVEKIQTLSKHICTSLNNAISFNEINNKNEQLNNELIERNELILHAGRLSAIGVLSKGIINEINQALSIIRLTSDELLMFFEQKEQDLMVVRSIKKIKPETDRAAMILDELSQYSSSEQYHTNNIKAIVQTSIRYFKHQLKTNNILLTFDCQEDLPEKQIDSKKFVQIITNLLSNSVHSLNEKMAIMNQTFQKEIIIKLYENIEIASIILSIDDNGLGMNAEQIEKCMEPFYTTKAKDEGTGLGLFIVRRLLSKLDMRIEVDSIEGKGSCFKIFIPLSNGDSFVNKLIKGN